MKKEIDKIYDEFSKRTFIIYAEKTDAGGMIEGFIKTGRDSGRVILFRDWKIEYFRLLKDEDKICGMLSGTVYGAFINRATSRSGFRENDEDFAQTIRTSVCNLWIDLNDWLDKVDKDNFNESSAWRDVSIPEDIVDEFVGYVLETVKNNEYKEES